MYPVYPYYSAKEECKEVPVSFPPQQQDRQPGLEYLMDPKPIFDNPSYVGSGKLRGKTAIITGGETITYILLPGKKLLFDRRLFCIPQAAGGYTFL